MYIQGKSIAKGKENEGPSFLLFSPYSLSVVGLGGDVAAAAALFIDARVDLQAFSFLHDNGDCYADDDEDNYSYTISSSPLHRLLFSRSPLSSRSASTY